MSTTYTIKTFCNNFNPLSTYLKGFLKKSKLDFLFDTYNRDIYRKIKKHNALFNETLSYCSINWKEGKDDFCC